MSRCHEQHCTTACRMLDFRMELGLLVVHVSPETVGEQAEAPKAVLKEGEISARSE